MDDVHHRSWRAFDPGCADAQTATRRLVTLANAADNITVIVLAVHEPPHREIRQRLRQWMAV